MMILCGFKPYTKEEKAKAILFDGVSPDAFVTAFELNEKVYYKKVVA